jgi:hypothetical protein
LNIHKCVLRSRITSFVIFATAVVALLAPVAGAQVYLYGRAGFPGTTGNLGSVIVADFNGDGRPDMAVSDSGNNWVSVLLGSPGGGFVANGTYATGASPKELVAADFNGDKKLDLAVVDSYAGTISILLGNGDGTFQSHIDYPVGQSPMGIVAADFNRDGKIDLATVSTSDNAVTILLGRGDGSFEVQGLIPVASTPTLLAAGDVNGDGKIDLITCNNNNSGTTITVLVSKGDGTFTQVQSPAPNSVNSLVVGDFNRDGKLDVIETVYGGLYLSLGNGDGSFQNGVQISNAPYVYGQGLLTGDFNHDSKLDLVMPGILVMLGNGDGTFQNPVLSAATSTPMAVVDVNGDGEPDLAAMTSSGGVAVLLGNGAGSFMDLRSIALASSPYSPAVGVAADFNGDGKLDMAVAEGNYPNGQVSVELGNGNGTFKQPVVSALSTTATSPYLMLTADFNGDGKGDLAVLDNNGNGFQVLLGRGDGSFGTAVDTPLSYSLSSLAAGDFNRDGKADLVGIVSNNGSPFLNVYLGNGDGTFSLGGQYIVYPNSYVSVADVNGDGNLDLVVAGSYYGGSNLLIFLGNGDGSFKNPIFGPSDYYTSQAVVEDFNGDGKLDIAIGTSNGIAFLAGNGDGTFGTQVYSNRGFQFSGSLIASDLNGDRKLDLAMTGSYYNAATQVMIGNGDGTFGLPQEYDSASNGYQLGAAVGDFNSDGVSDLAIPGSSSNAPVVFLYLSTPTPSLLPTALNFGAEQVGKTSSPKKVKLTNEGNAELKISSITVSGDFLEQNNCGKGLAVGKSCTIQVSFKPQAKGVRMGVVTVTDNAPGRRQTVSLKGTGK